MGARQKLNQAYFNGAIIVALVFGLVSQSWTVFLLTLVISAAMSLYAGEIRPRRRGP